MRKVGYMAVRFRQLRLMAMRKWLDCSLTEALMSMRRVDHMAMHYKLLIRLITSGLLSYSLIEALTSMHCRRHLTKALRRFSSFCLVESADISAKWRLGQRTTGGIRLQPAY